MYQRFWLWPLSTVASTGKRNYADLAREQVVRSRTFLPRYKSSKLRWYRGFLRGEGRKESYELNVQLTLSGKNMSTTLNIQQYWELLANNVGYARLHGAWEFSLSGYAFNHRICLLESSIHSVLSLKAKTFLEQMRRRDAHSANKFTSSDVHKKINKWKQMQISVFNLITRISRFPLSYKTFFYLLQ